MKTFEYCIFIGRFQPFHWAHYQLIKEALLRANRIVVILGSANTAPNIRNPFSVVEREEMIRVSLTEAENKRTTCIKMRDYLYNDNLWLTDLQQKVFDVVGEGSVALIGHEHDRSSYYLKLFPQWEFISMKNFDEHPHATEIRKLYFESDFSSVEDYKKHVPAKTAEFMEAFKKKSAYQDLVQEYKYLDKYKKAWEKAPFPPTFNTVDAVVVKSGHVLVVRRKGYPGKGLIALPGGFLNQNEKIRDGVLRELKEETAIKLSKEELGDAIQDQRVFDHPDRSLRGRTITHAFLINLKSGPLPQVKGSDDADKAWWMPLSEFYTKEQEFFEDHFHIISFFVNRF